MLVCLLEVINRREEVLRMEVETEFSVLKRNGVSYPVQKKTPVRLTLMSPEAKRVLIQAEAEYVLTAPCDRCLREVELPFEIRYAQEIDFSKPEEERGEEPDGISCISGYDLDVNRLILEEILVDFPAKVLCRQDCKGICSVCGKNLNEGACGCGCTEDAREEHLDPRMAVIRDIFNNFNESSSS